MDKVHHHHKLESPDFSVIIPIADEDGSWVELVRQLRGSCGENIEILLCLTPRGFKCQKEVILIERVCDLRLVISEAGRACQMNSGARFARGRFLWFVHADSRLGHGCFENMLRRALLETKSEFLYYCDLEFLQGGPACVRLNELGVFVRTRVFGLPFGDQGYCLPKSYFEALGRYDQSLPYGEDHELVWRIHNSGGIVRSIHSKMLTSARKYTEHGWLRTTLKHLVLTVRQAADIFLEQRIKKA